MSSAKKMSRIDTDEDEYDQDYLLQTRSLKGSRFQSPKQPWKPSKKTNSLANSQTFVGQTVKRKAPKYPLPSQSCAREKQELRHQICHLEESIKSKNQKIKNLKYQLNDEKMDKQEIDAELRSQKEWKDIAEQLRYENQKYKQNEINLYNELQEQQILTKEALQKLYENREQMLIEKEQLREMYEQYADDRVQEERVRNMEQINNLLDLNDKLKGQVHHVELQMESVKKQEKLLNQVHNYKSAIQRKKQLQEVEDQKIELLKQSKYQREQYNRDLENIKLQVALKEKENVEKEYERIQREKYHQQLELDQSRRHYDLEFENEQLRRELHQRNDQLRNSQVQWRSKKNDELNSSLNNFQSQLSNIKYDLEDLKYENRKILTNISPRK